MRKYPFHTAYTQARELYGLELNPDEFETVGLIGWDRIGNRDYKLYKFVVEPQEDSIGQWYVDLPCNLDVIEAVTAEYEDYQKTSNQSVAGEIQTGFIDDYIESRKFNTNPLYTKGKFIKYWQEGNRLKLADRFAHVNILYKGVVTDDDGLPLLNEKELDAIAVFCAYTSTFKAALVTKDAATMQLSQILELKWKSLCSQARVPSNISQNEMDEILNVSTSWDRKRFGRSYKPIK